MPTETDHDASIRELLGAYRAAHMRYVGLATAVLESVRQRKSYEAITHLIADCLDSSDEQDDEVWAQVDATFKALRGEEPT